MTEDEQEHRKEEALESWRPRWAFFSLVWALLVLSLAIWLQPAFTALDPLELALVTALVVVIPPALDYFFSLAIADVMERRVRRRH